MPACSVPQAQDMLRNLYLGSCFLLFVVGLAQLAADMDFYSSKTLWGSTCVAILAVYYTAPLSSLAKVISQRDSSSLHWPLCSMNIINGMLWFAYGLVSFVRLACCMLHLLSSHVLALPCSACNPLLVFDSSVHHVGLAGTHAGFCWRELL